jgi:hypothetical protein
MKLAPELKWMTIVMRALCATHPDPALLRKAFGAMAEEKIAQTLRHEEDEDWLQLFLLCRGGYEAWIPMPGQQTPAQ